MFKIAVVGSRGFNDFKLMQQKLDFYFQNKRDDIVMYSGTARGADRLGEQYAALRKMPVVRFPAKWKQYGRQAGYIRNEQMLKRADALVAFWDGKSPGTAHAIEFAKQRGLSVRVVRY